MNRQTTMTSRGAWSFSRGSVNEDTVAEEPPGSLREGDAGELSFCCTVIAPNDA